MSKSVIGVPVAVAALTTAIWAGGCGGDDETTAPNTVAQVILIRGGENAGSGLEVLLVLNGAKVVFSPGAWVFPFASIDSDDGDDEARRATAASALAEMAGVTVDPAELVAYGRWIAPIAETHFYLALAPARATPQPDGSSTVDAGWFEPQQALDMHRAGKLPMGYATIKQLESLVGFANAADALETARSREVTPVELRIVGEGEKRRAVLPDEVP